MKYLIFYEDVQIGVLEINAAGQHKYTPNISETNKVKDKVSLYYELLTETGWREPIPIFKNKIDDAKKFAQESDIASHTDSFRMVQVS